MLYLLAVGRIHDADETAHNPVHDLRDLRSDTLGRDSQTGLPEIEGTRSAQKVVASREKGGLKREGSCYYSEPGAAGVLRRRRGHLEVAEGRRLGELQGGEDLALAGSGQ